MSLREGQKIRDTAVLEWVRCKGDETLSLTHDLNSSSLVIDFGGYTGEWSEKIFKRYDCALEIYEPFSDFAEIIKQKFDKNQDKVKIFNCALGKGNFQASLIEDDIATRVVENSSGNIKVIDAASVILDRRVDLLKMNIEGSEYEVFESLFENNSIQNIDAFFIQFHPIDDNSIKQYQEIISKLSETHDCVFRFPFIWEKWTIRRNNH